MENFPNIILASSYLLGKLTNIETYLRHNVKKGAGVSLFPSQNQQGELIAHLSRHSLRFWTARHSLTIYPGSKSIVPFLELPILMR